MGKAGKIVRFAILYAAVLAVFLISRRITLVHRVAAGIINPAHLIRLQAKECAGLFAVVSILYVLGWFFRYKVRVEWVWHIAGRTFRLGADRLLLVCAGILCAVMLYDAAHKVNRSRQYAAQINRVSEMVAGQDAIIHAGGTVWDPEGNPVYYTNCREAIENALSSGRRVIEIDMRVTTDGEIACVHWWNQIFDENHPAEEKSMSLDEFLSRKVEGMFTPLSGDDLAELMRSFEDLYIVTDIHGANKNVIRGHQILSEKYADVKDRFIVQIYDTDQYEDMFRMGFHNIIYTLYRADDLEKSIDAVRSFCYSHFVTGITAKKNRKDMDELIQVLSGIGQKIFVHTVNTQEQQLAWLERGADAVYINNP